MNQATTFLCSREAVMLWFQFCFTFVLEMINLIGVTLSEKAPNSEGTMVDVGLSKVLFSSSQTGISQSDLFLTLCFTTTCDLYLMLVMQSVVVDQVLSPGVRVTVAMGTDRDLGTDNHYFLSNYCIHLSSIFKFRFR